MEGDIKHIFFLLKDPAWDKLKPEKVHIFGVDYLNDGSAELIEKVFNEALEYMQKTLFTDQTFPFFYWTYEGKGSFIDLWVTPDLLNDSRAFAAFLEWLEQTVRELAFGAKLPMKVERDKAREYILKLIISIPVTPPADGKN